MFIVSIVIICVSIGCMVEVIYQSKKMRENYELRLSSMGNDLLKAREETRITRTTLEGRLRNLQIEYDKLKRMRGCEVMQTVIPTITINSTISDDMEGWKRDAGLCLTTDEIKEQLILNMIPDLKECLEISETRNLCTNKFVTLGTLRVAKKV